MQLINFRILNYRSINNSGQVSVGKITSLVGRNESGKTCLLLALQTLNPPGGMRDLSPIKDFPRHRRLAECKDDTPVVFTTWALTPQEQTELATLFPRAAGVSQVQIGRYYKSTPRWVEFLGLKPIPFSIEEVESRIRKIRPVVEAKPRQLNESAQTQTKAALEQLLAILSATTEVRHWATDAVPALANFRKSLGAVAISLPTREEGLIVELEELAAQILRDEPAHAAARTWVVERLPIFVYVDDYPQLTGHQNIAEYLSRKGANPPQLTQSDQNFQKMCKVADLSPEQLHSLHTANDHETRNQLTNRASAIVTSELRRLWKDRPLKVRFSPDANHLDTFISDPNSVYDVEVNLDERSRGFKWFFSFYITFSADTKGGSSANAILLLDEPGLFLHALSQGDLLHHLSTDFSNQIIYTTHSPFMVPTENLDAIRTVNIDQDAGTTVSDNLTGDSRTLFPIQAALGFAISQSLFVGPHYLVVEDVTDFWLLSCVSDYLSDQSKPALPKELTLTPAGGTPRVLYMLALLMSEPLRVLVLFDDEQNARMTKTELVKQKLIQDDSVVFVTEGFLDARRPSEADVEDLIDPPVYDALVQQSYSKELTGKTLALNANIPRIVKRYEKAFGNIGIDFHTTRPARLFLRKAVTEPLTVMTPAMLERFSRLFERVSQLHAKNVARAAGPFH